jgi:hypothetical protein
MSRFPWINLSLQPQTMGNCRTYITMYLLRSLKDVYTGNKYIVVFRLKKNDFCNLFDYFLCVVTCSCFKRPSFKLQTRYQCQKISLHTTISEPVNDYRACLHLQNRLNWAHKMYRVKNVTLSVNKFVTSASNNG